MFNLQTRNVKHRKIITLHSQHRSRSVLAKTKPDLSPTSYHNTTSLKKEQSAAQGSAKKMLFLWRHKTDPSKISAEMTKIISGSHVFIDDAINLLGRLDKLPQEMQCKYTMNKFHISKVTTKDSLALKKNLRSSS